jgi:hypothetical protein
MPMADTLHVTNGDSAATTLRETVFGEDVLSWADVLHEGPVPLLPPAELRATRARFLGEVQEDGQPALAELEDRDARLGQALADRRQIVIWLEHDLHDQLQLLQILDRLAGREAGPVHLINIGSFPGRPHFRGLGELTARDLETLWPQARPVTAELAELGRSGFEAFRRPEPTALERFLSGDTHELPFLAPALRRLLEEFPDAQTGLARSERHLLEALATRRRTRGGLFLASQEAEEAPYTGDTWVWRRLDELGAGEHPLVELGSILDLTEAGRAVLAGAADRIALLGVDRWLGGTHLTPDDLWRWDRASGRVVRAS